MDKYRVPVKELIRRIWIPGTWASQRLLIIAALVLIITAVAANGSAEVYPAAMLQSATGTPVPLAVATSTLIPAIATNQTQTNGLIIGGVILVLIIIGGTLGVIRRKSFE